MSTRAAAHAARVAARELRMAQKRSLDAVVGVEDLGAFLKRTKQQRVVRREPTLLQLNIGLTCNLACHHCHVESSPVRRETLAEETSVRIIDLLATTPSIRTVDITGGAPEMHGAFRSFVEGARSLGLRVIDRCNLTILEQPGYEWVDGFLAEQGVDVIASMPCYSVKNVEAQRGDGVFDESIAALRKLNARGYGVEGSGLALDLVYNPGGPSLPPDQSALEADYKRELDSAFGIAFNNLFCITNMPIKRFADDLRKSGELANYMELLPSSFNAENLESVMCRDMVHVGPNGVIHDCDFNYALGLTSRLVGGHSSASGATSASSMRSEMTVHDVDSFNEFGGQDIVTGKHCWGCVAGSGSS